jgi:2-oxo-4-hydroxy-4-carboxy-5-ureidoimidazoline decarboxylase
MNKVLAHWNTLDPASAAREALPCCGSNTWATELAARRPIPDEPSLIAASNAVWLALPEQDWREAFDSHPRIGQQKPPSESSTTPESLHWSAQEQRTAQADDSAKQALAEANLRYEQRFGRIFIVCASDKSAVEILAILNSRMSNDSPTELREAAEQQRQITELRLHRWLEQD